MPVGSFVIGAEDWTPIGHLAPGDTPRMLPVGALHATEPQDGTTACGGLVVSPDRERRSFVPWAAGTCERCNEALAPRAAPTPPEEP